MHRTFALLPFAAGLALAGAAPAAHAAEFSVNSPADAGDLNIADGVCSAGGVANGKCTLRAALGQAAHIPGADRIVVPAGTYQLLGELGVASSVTIDGAGARSTIIRAATNSRVMSASANLNLRDVTITGADVGATGTVQGGGLLVTAGDVALERVAVSGNTVRGTTAGVGAGIAAGGGSLSLIDSTVTGNNAYGRFNGSGGGGALGGGIHTVAPTVVRRSTIAGNGTFSWGAQEFSVGGGVYAGETTILDHTTLAGNVAATVNNSSGFRYGGNVYVNGGALVTLAGTVLAGGAATVGANCHIASGAISEPKRNLVSNGDCLGASSLKDTDPLLGALGDNGGPTDTMRPISASPLVNAATGCGTRPTDQRGGTLPAGAACDLGSVELGADRRLTLQASKSAPAAGEEVTLVVSLTNDGLDTATGDGITITLPTGAAALTATSTGGACTVGATIVCSAGSLAKGASTTVLATVRAAGTPGTITAQRTGPLPDPATANDAASIALSAAATSTGPGGGSGGGKGDDVGQTPSEPSVVAPQAAPIVSGLKVARKPTLKKGAELQFTLSAAAKVRVVVERLRPARLKGTTCKTGLKKGRACTKATVTETREVTLPAGPAKVLVAKKKLRQGKVRFTVTPLGGAPRILTATVRKR